MKILITEFRQESNSFNPTQSTLEFWNQTGEYQGQTVRDTFSGQQCTVGGFLQALDESPHHPEVVCGTVMASQSGGVAEQQVMDHYLERLIPQIEEAGPLDGVFISFHGALMTTRFDDPEGEITRRVRAVVGDDTVIAVALDLHAYVSQTLVQHANVIIGYLTYPHVDHFETGVRTATLGINTIANPDRPVTAWVPIPMIAPAASYNTLDGAFKEVVDRGHALRDAGNIIDFTVYQMQPWLDIPEPNSSAIVVAKTRDEAAKYATELAELLYDKRYDFKSSLAAIDDVIGLAKDRKQRKPVILVDSADSCNAGASGDNMAVADRILAIGSGLRAATVVNDAPAAHLAHQLGVGATAQFTLGATRNPASTSITATGRVKSLHDGVFRQEGPAGRGITQSIGLTAVIAFGGLDVVVCEWMAGNGDPQLYRAHGIEPTLYDLVVVKASTSFRAGYTAFAGDIVEADTPGAASSDLMNLPFARLPKTIYPWQDDPSPQWNVTFAPIAGHQS
jgi:microcystin degradation protein MlrC